MTEEFSILDLHANTDTRKAAPTYFPDLNLETVMDRLADKWGRDVRKYFLYLPATPEDEAYRRAVYGDVKRDAVYNALTAFEKRLAGADELRREKEKVPGIRQRAVWQLREAEAYCIACEELAEALGKAEPDSEGMRRFREILQGILEGEFYRKMREELRRVMGSIRGTRLVITYEKDRIQVAEGTAETEYEPLPAGERKPLQNPFIANPVITELESECLDILKKKNPEFFREILAAAEQYEHYDSAAVLRFAAEVKFYLSYAMLQRDMEEKGFAFAVPSVSADRPMAARGLYDLALACVNVKKGKKVVANDFDYRDGERFFVLTGPNQGGKTTFARSMGQLVYFTRIGLDMPAAEANVPFFRDIQTHFSVEESMETGRGKLQEELVRLKPMMAENRQGTFVVINELFTTAASYDALIMGRKVLEHFIGLGCTGIYVTHLKELIAAHEGVAALQATLDAERVQTFEIRRGEAPDIACAENQVNKYRLTYEQLKERL